MKNIVVVAIDSQQVDHCGFVGYDCDTTPTQDVMARERLVFGDGRHAPTRNRKRGQQLCMIKIGSGTEYRGCIL